MKATIQAAPDFDAYAGIVHDKQCYAVNFAYESKTLLLLLLGEREEDPSLEIRFYDVLGYEMQRCDISPLRQPRTAIMSTVHFAVKSSVFPNTLCIPAVVRLMDATGFAFLALMTFVSSSTFK